MISSSFLKSWSFLGHINESISMPPTSHVFSFVVDSSSLQLKLNRKIQTNERAMLNVRINSSKNPFSTHFNIQQMARWTDISIEFTTLALYIFFSVAHFFSQSAVFSNCSRQKKITCVSPMRVWIFSLLQSSEC